MLLQPILTYKTPYYLKETNQPHVDTRIMFRTNHNSMVDLRNDTNYEIPIQPQIVGSSIRIADSNNRVTNPLKTGGKNTVISNKIKACVSITKDAYMYYAMLRS